MPDQNVLERNREKNRGENKEKAMGTEEHSQTKGRHLIVPGVGIRGAVGAWRDHSSLIGEGHSTVQAVLASKHAMSVKDLHSRNRVSHPPKDKNFQ